MHRNRKLVIAGVAAALLVSVLGLRAWLSGGGDAVTDAEDARRVAELQAAASRPDPAAPPPIVFTEPPPAPDDGLLKRAN